MNTARHLRSTAADALAAVGRALGAYFRACACSPEMAALGVMWTLDDTDR